MSFLEGVAVRRIDRGVATSECEMLGRLVAREARPPNTDDNWRLQSIQGVDHNLPSTVWDILIVKPSGELCVHPHFEVFFDLDA